jgi:transcriptional regulator with XRE-family HTH domain
VTLDYRPMQYTRGMDRARIGALVRERRELLKKTQPECAAQSDMTKGNWWHIEHATTSAPIDTLVKMAQALDAHWVVRLVAGPERVRDPDRQELIDIMDRLADRLDDRDVQLLLVQLRLYEGDARSKAT